MGDDSINLVFSVDFCQCLSVKSWHLIRPVASRLVGMRPRISSEAIGSEMVSTRACTFSEAYVFGSFIGHTMKQFRGIKQEPENLLFQLGGAFGEMFHLVKCIADVVRDRRFRGQCSERAYRNTHQAYLYASLKTCDYGK